MLFRRFYSGGLLSARSGILDLSDEVEFALRDKRPLVALESTIVTHGMPYPVNYETTNRVMNIIRRQGAIPAPVAIIKGRIKVGLSSEQLQFLADPSSEAVKTSRRDFPYTISQKLNGGTTVSGTLLVAAQLGINFFATGGVGGVHRGGESSLDVSADLVELSRSSTMVISSGFKSILDIPRTLEFLETQGVLVCSFGSKELPSFYSSECGLKAPYSVNTAREAAALMVASHDLQLNSGIILAVPIPSAHSIPYEQMEREIEKAVEEAAKSGVGGKQLTPFLLEKVSQLTAGASLSANIALIENNALVGAQVAVQFSEMTCGADERATGNMTLKSLPPHQKNPVVVGGCVLDCVLSLEAPFKADGRTVSGRLEECGGGVGRNLADALGRLGSRPTLVSLVGQDLHGKAVLQSIQHLERECVEVVEGARTATFVVLVDEHGECLLVAGDTAINKKLDTQLVMRHRKKIENSSVLVLEGNLPVPTMQLLLELAEKNGIFTWYEPTDMSLCDRLLECPLWTSVGVASPNLLELKHMALKLGVRLDEEFSVDDVDKLLKQVMTLATPLASNMGTLVVTMGRHGTMVVSRRGETEGLVGVAPLEGRPLHARYYPVTPAIDIVNASGAGDCGAAGMLCGGLAGLDEASCVGLGHLASLAALRAPTPVPHAFPHLQPVPATFHSLTF